MAEQRLWLSSAGREALAKPRIGEQETAEIFFAAPKAQKKNLDRSDTVKCHAMQRIDSEEVFFSVISKGQTEK